VLKNYKTAINWYTLSAKQGNSRAQHNLALMFHSGNGVLQDYKTAVKWYERSAKQGNKNSQVNLGQMYFIGLGIEQDNVHAYMWWKIAKLNGNITVAKNLVIVAERMTKTQILNAEKLVNEFLSKKFNES
jgi:TPR repeat protein